MAVAQTATPAPSVTPALSATPTTATAQPTAAASATPAAKPTSVPTTAPKKPSPAPTPLNKPVPISAAHYRAILQKALLQIEALQKHAPRPLEPILKKLDAAYAVRRADGATQTVYGDVWSNMDAIVEKDATREQVATARFTAIYRIHALDEWTKAPYYTATDAKKIIANLETTGQIRSGPLWWQKVLSDAWKAVGDAWTKLMDWLSSLLPKPSARATPKITAPDEHWLWALFYGFVLILLGFVFWFAFRAFGGGWKRSKMPREVQLQSEDAALLLLPPEELSSRADQFAAQGNFREALRHRYLALLLRLDSRGIWRYDARRTNWEHIASLRRSEAKSALVPPLSDLTRRFDRVRYGGAPCDGEGWRQFDNDVRQFETTSLSAQSGVAA